MFGNFFLNRKINLNLVPNLAKRRDVMCNYFNTPIMNFTESISNYVLENYSIEDLPKIAGIAIEENLSSEAIYILAKMSKNDSSANILKQFQASLNELKIKLPNKELAAKILINYYLNLIIKDIDNGFQIMQKVDTEVYRKVKNVDSFFWGEEFKIESLYTWYGQIKDWNNNDDHRYYMELSRDGQLIKYKEHLVEEAKETLKNNYT